MVGSQEALSWVGDWLTSRALVGLDCYRSIRPRKSDENGWKRLCSSALQVARRSCRLSIEGASRAFLITADGRGCGFLDFERCLR